MALGGAPSLVVLLLSACLCHGLPPGAGWDQEIGNEQVSAPPNMMYKVTAAAKATVAAGYTNTAEESAEVDTTAAHGIVSTIPAAQGAVSEMAVEQAMGSGVPEVYVVMSGVPMAHKAAGYTNMAEESAEVDTTAAHGIVSTIPAAQGAVSEMPVEQAMGSGVPEVHAVVSEVPMVHKAAGYTNTAEESAEVDTTAAQGIVFPIPAAQGAESEMPVQQGVVSGVPEVHAVVSEVPQVVSEVPQAHAVLSKIMVVQGTVAEVVTTSPSTSSGKEAIIVVGDTRYTWQDWSKWYCNCPEGSMSRTRDITYLAPGVHLDPTQYDVLRFEREVCSYQVCLCNRESHECDHLAVTCAKGPMHLCALEDIKQGQMREREQFWNRIYEGLKTLWQVIRDIFPKTAKERSE